MKVPFLDLRAQSRQIKDEVLSLVTETMASGTFIGGTQVSGFENEFAEFCDNKFCVGVGSGTDALRFALMAAGVGPGDEVVTVPNTFIATTEAISQVGATPAFVDIDEYTYTMDPRKLNEFMEIRNATSQFPNRLKAIVPVHLYGQFFRQSPIPVVNGLVLFLFAFFLPFMPIVILVGTLGQSRFGRRFPSEIGILFEIPFQQGTIT